MARDARAAESGAALFVYGTLMDESRVESVTGRRFARRAARLEGYERIAPPGGYPYVLPRRGGSVEGVLLEGIDPDSLRALDRYEEEGRLYLRRPVVVVAGGDTVSCETYVGATRPRARARGRRSRRTSGG